MAETTKQNLTTDEPHEDYHAKRGLFMTSHLLISAFRGMAEFIEDFRSPKGDSDALYFGRASHVYTLEGEDRFYAEYVVGGPVNPKTGNTYGTKSKKFQEWARDQPLPAISPEEFELIRTMAASVHRQKAAQQLLADGEAEVTGRTEIAGVPCQVRVDWLTRCNRLVDYKTTSDLSTIAVSCDQYGYLIQQAFYRQVVREITGKSCPVYLIWCEKTPEAPSVVWRLDEDKLAEQERANEAKIVEVRDLFIRLRKEKLCQLSEPSSTPLTPPQTLQCPPPQVVSAT